MIKSSFLICFLICCFGAVCQNLVPNGGFEAYNECPDGLRQLGRALDWTAANAGSPELFHACGFTADVSPYEGDGMAGAIFLASGRDGVEYLQVKLIDSLKENTDYCFECKLLPNHSSFVLINKIGALFTKERLYTPNWIPFIEHPQIEAEEVVADLVNWTDLKGSFTAKGGERYLTVGNFYERYSLEFKSNSSGSSSQSYYFVDEVKLWEKQGSCSSIPLSEKYVREKPSQNISHTVYFEIDNSEISLEEKKALFKFFKTVRSNHSLRLKIVGHTDSDASQAYNLLLSKRRTETVDDFIQQMQETDTYLIWQGEDKPETDNGDTKKKALNRRVVISVLP